MFDVVALERKGRGGGGSGVRVFQRNYVIGIITIVIICYLHS